jgi:predicted hydrocarbon binding protein
MHMFEERDESQFQWSMLGDIKEGRPNLGPWCVSVYRLHYTLRDLLIRDHGVAEATGSFEAGKKAGEQYCTNLLAQNKDLNAMLTELEQTMRDLGIGILRIESADIEKGCFVITVAEDLDCSGIPVCSEEICIYDEGFIAGLLLAYTGRDFRVKEVDCWGTGDRVCRFQWTPMRSRYDPRYEGSATPFPRCFTISVREESRPYTR